MCVVPDHDHMLWHHSKEEFACEKLFGKQPQIKGAIAGQPGNRTWAIWTHRYYGETWSSSSGNTLCILRPVVEHEVAAISDSSECHGLSHDAAQHQLQVSHLRAVLRAAQTEAAEWSLSNVKLWNPTSMVQELLEQTGLQYGEISREDESIASLLWYGEGIGEKDMLEWVANKKFAWCWTT